MRADEGEDVGLGEEVVHGRDLVVVGLLQRPERIEADDDDRVDIGEPCRIEPHGVAVIADALRLRRPLAGHPADLIGEGGEVGAS